MAIKVGLLLIFFSVMVGIGLYCRRHATETVMLVIKVIFSRISALIQPYSGITTLQPINLRRSALGKAPATSARPPDIAKGKTSLEANKTFISCFHC